MPLISEFGSGPSAQPAHHAVPSQLLRLSTMDPKSQRQKGRDRVLSSLNVAIEALNLAKDAAGIAPAQAAFSSVSALLTMIRVHFLLSCDDGLQVHTYPGLHGKQNQLR